MIFVQINLCEIENPARLRYFRAYEARGWEPRDVRAWVISKYVVRRKKTYNPS